MANVRTFTKDGMCTINKPKMETADILRRYCECMESGKYATAEKLAGRMATTKRNEKMKYAWLKADLASCAFKPKVNYQRYEN